MPTTKRDKQVEQHLRFQSQKGATIEKVTNLTKLPVGGLYFRFINLATVFTLRMKPFLDKKKYSQNVYYYVKDVFW